MLATVRRLSTAAIAAACFGALAAPADAQLLQRRDLSLAMALEMTTTAIAHCRAQGYGISVAVVGRNGEILVHVRGDDTNPHTMDNSFRKAYTSRTFRVPSGVIVERYNKNPQLFAVWLPNVVPSQGALPIMVGKEVIGAIGASGAPGGQRDEECVKAGIDKVAHQLK